jgi:hypothetical protein
MCFQVRSIRGLSMSVRWDHHFLRLCQDHARMSKDPSTRVGAVIVGPDGEIRSAGFNGFPRGILDSDDRLNDRETKLKLMVHGEMNAILAAARVGTPVKGCTSRSHRFIRTCMGRTSMRSMHSGSNSGRHNRSCVLPKACNSIKMARGSGAS